MLLFTSCRVSYVSSKHHQKIILTPETKKIETSLYKNHDVTVRDNKRYTWYADDKIHETEGGYSGYLLDGEYKEYKYPGNELIVSGYMHRGLKTGQWVYWYENGIVKERSEWKDGHRHGETICYRDNGQLLSVTQYNNGLRHGKKVLFHVDGKTSVETYKNDILVTENIFVGKQSDTTREKTVSNKGKTSDKPSAHTTKTIKKEKKPERENKKKQHSVTGKK